MKLFNEIQANQQLRFINEADPGKVFRLEDLSLLSLPGNTRRLALLYLDNTLPAITILLSFLKSPHVCALLSPDLAPHFKDELERRYEPAYIYDPARTDITGYQYAADQPLFTRDTLKDVNIHPDVKLLLSTSGTTGSPKFVKLSENNLLENAKSIAGYLPVCGTDVTPLNLPVYYSYGLSVLTSNAIFGGTLVCCHTDILNREFWSGMEQLGYTSIAGVPFVYEMLDRIGFTKKDYPSLKYFTQAGGRLREALVHKFAAYASEKRYAFYVMYGQTEATARMAYLPPAELERHPSAIGVPIPGGTFDIDPDNGELLYAGPNVFGGYVTGINDLSDYSQPAWLRTGDLARKDEDGFYYITGRINRFVKLFGSRINLDEVEQLLAINLDVPVKAVGIEDKLMLLVTDRPEVDEQTVAALITTTLKLHPSVVKVWTVPELPLTANGKTDYTRIQKMYAER
ncbi:AMP-binding protein [Taibaiella chishuiensis]|uniref:Acyl-CoA synthetase (AMP-forming)/AMP-acid ligase II n=1 Tax=Taibaiella chishuiensis TaxID=1434707 RepID=A0A2P8D9S6_9BACT|nr:AMP-binding protein [Taibaiella chishuiensis]PSK93976.1 acyl-CoA synthetase (AMP-forming)/AMP-acid ligase II [Taibaiella chishuiensis]